MKKFFVILVLLVIFIICAAFGFTGTKSAWDAVSGAAPPKEPTPVSPVSTSPQHNFLLLHVDDLSSQQPALISAWLFLVTYTDQPTLVMKILHPRAEISSLAADFSLDPNGRVSQKFQDEIAKLNIPWDGYLVLDTQGMQIIHQWLLGQDLEPVPFDPLAPPDGFTLFVYESRQLNALCQSLHQASPSTPSLSWRQLTPGHFRSDLPFENLILMWDYLTRSASPPYCEVIPWG